MNNEDFRSIQKQITGDIAAYIYTPKGLLVRIDLRHKLEEAKKAIRLMYYERTDNYSVGRIKENLKRELACHVFNSIMENIEIVQETHFSDGVDYDTLIASIRLVTPKNVDDAILQGLYRTIESQEITISAFDKKYDRLLSDWNALRHMSLWRVVWIRIKERWGRNK